MIFPQMPGPRRRNPPVPKSSYFGPGQNQGAFAFPQMGQYSAGKVVSRQRSIPMVPAARPSAVNAGDILGRLQGWSWAKLLGQVERKTFPAPAGNTKTPNARYEQMGSAYYDTGYGLYRTAAGAWKFRTATGDISRAYVRAYVNRPRHWASPMNVTPTIRPISHVQSLPIQRGYQREIYARTTYGTSRFQLLHLYLSAFTPAVFQMQTYYNIAKYAITPKRLGTFGVVPIQAQGRVAKRWPWQTTPHGYPVPGSWPMGITS